VSPVPCPLFIQFAKRTASKNETKLTERPAIALYVKLPETPLRAMPPLP
jgi:hypothetical protein